MTAKTKPDAKAITSDQLEEMFDNGDDILDYVDTGNPVVEHHPPAGEAHHAHDARMDGQRTGRGGRRSGDQPQRRRQHMDRRPAAHHATPRNDPRLAHKRRKAPEPYRECGRFGGFVLSVLGGVCLEGACADDDADSQGDGIDSRRGRIGPRPAPYGAEGLHGRSRYRTVGRCCRWRRCRRRCR